MSGGVAPVVYLLLWDECTMFAAVYGGTLGSVIMAADTACQADVHLGCSGAVFGGVAGMITWLIYPLIKACPGSAEVT